MRNWISYILLALSIVFALYYFLWLRDEVPNILSHNGPKFWQQIFDWFYPRLLSEKGRYINSLLFDRADQLAIRISSLMAFAGITFWGYNNSSLVKNFIHDKLNSKIHIKSYDRSRRALYLITFYCTWDWAYDMLALGTLHPFYKPISFLSILDVPFPLSGFAVLYCSMLLVFCLFLIFNFKPLFASIYVAVLFIVIQAFIYSFEKVDHHLAPLTYVLIIFPFWVHERERQKDVALISSWPFVLIRISVVLPYFFSALEKLLISGKNWLDGTQIKSYLLFYQPELFQKISVIESESLLVIGGCAVVGFQLLFPLVLIIPKLKWFFIPAGIIFHLLTFTLMGIGGWIHPWVLMYFFLFDWTPKNVGKPKQKD